MPVLRSEYASDGSATQAQEPVRPQRSEPRGRGEAAQQVHRQAPRVWRYAAEHGFTVVSKDADERSFLLGHPQKSSGSVAATARPTRSLRASIELGRACREISDGAAQVLLRHPRPGTLVLRTSFGAPSSSAGCAGKVTIRGDIVSPTTSDVEAEILKDWEGPPELRVIPLDIHVTLP